MERQLVLMSMNMTFRRLNGPAGVVSCRNRRVPFSSMRDLTSEASYSHRASSAPNSQALKLDENLRTATTTTIITRRGSRIAAIQSQPRPITISNQIDSFCLCRETFPGRMYYTCLKRDEHVSDTIDGIELPRRLFRAYQPRTQGDAVRLQT